MSSNNRKDDDYYEPNMSTDTFILYATAMILSFLTILFCICHPEILMVICMNFQRCCCGGRGTTTTTTGGETVVTKASQDYVGGIQMEKREDGESQREMI